MIRLKTRPAYPFNIEREYLRVLDSALNKYWAEIQKKLKNISLVQTGFTTDSALSDLFEQLKNDWGQISNTIKPLFEQIALKTDRFQWVQFEKQHKEYSSLIGINQQTGFLKFGDMTGVLQNATEQNVLLIKDLGSRFTDQLTLSIMDAVANGESPRTISKKLREQFKITKKRADLIAVDQIGKLYGNLTKARQQQNGFSEYEWITVKDNRVRPAHKAREGQVFNWDNPPEDGHPGQPIRCRCIARPVIKDSDWDFTKEESEQDAREEAARKARLERQLKTIKAMNTR